MTLHELNDWVVIPRIRRAPGVAEVSNFGGLAKQFSIELPPGQLRRFGMTFDDIVKAVETNNAVAGGSVMRRGGTSFVIRGTGSLRSTEEIGRTFVKSVVIVALRQRGKSVNFNAPGQCCFSCGWILGARQSKLPTLLLGNLDLDSVWTMLI